jgi:hypothetical protein
MSASASESDRLPRCSLRRWGGERLREILLEPQPDANTPPDTFAKLIRTMMDVGEATDEGPGREKAPAALNRALAREGFEAFYTADKQCYMERARPA